MIGHAKVTQASQVLDFAGFDAAIGRAQRYLALAAVFVVPLIVLPETRFIDFTLTPKGTALSVIGWLLIGLMGARIVLRALQSSPSTFDHATRFIQRPKVLVILLSMASLAVCWSLISALASPFGSFTFWGREPGAGGGAIGAVLLLAICLATFWSVRESRRARPFILALAVSACIAAGIGFAQYFGFSPLGISNTHTSAGRVTGTAGNPVFFGALLAMAAPVVLTLPSLFRVNMGSIDRRAATALVLLTVLFTVALVATASRGPWLGAVTGLGVTAGVLVWVQGFRRATTWGTLVALSVVITVALMSLTGNAGNRNEGEAGTGITSAPALDRVVATGSIDRRFAYWSMAVDLSFSRPEVPLARSGGWLTSFLFGYGPDTARYVLPLQAEPRLFGNQFTTVHNDALNRLLEQGLVGFAIWAGLWAAIAAALYRLARNARRTRTSTRLLLAAGLAGAFAARFIEQLTGVPMPGDQVIFWVLVGTLAAAIVGPAQAVEMAPKTGIRLTTGRQVAFAGIAGGIAVLSIFGAWDRGLSYLVASNHAAVLSDGGTVQYSAAVDSLVQATKLAPDVPAYRLLLADVYRDAAGNSLFADRQVELLTLAHGQAKSALESNPYELDSNFRLAQAAWELGQLGVSGKAQEAIETYERMLVLAPNHPLVSERLQLLRSSIVQ